MAVGKYVSVSSQRDSQRSELENEQALLAFIAGGILAMAITYGIGSLVGAQT